MLFLPGLSACSWRCCSCSAWSWQTGPVLARLLVSRDKWPGSCSMLETRGFFAVFLVTAPCAGQETSATGLPARALLNHPHGCTSAPRREREIEGGKREMRRSRVTNHTEEGAKQIGTSRGCVLAADGLCAGCSLVLVWICKTVRSTSPSGTRLEEPQ